MKCLYGIDSLVLFALMNTIDEIPGDWVPAFLENPEHRRNTNDWIMLNSSTDFLKICYMACLAIDKIPNDKGGRPKNFPLNRLVYDLASAYKQFTGKKPTRIYDGMNQMPIGPFFSFVKAYLDIVDPGGYYSENSIDNAIKETMSRWEAENTATLNDKQEQNHP